MKVGDRVEHTEGRKITGKVMKIEGRLVEVLQDSGHGRIDIDVDYLRVVE